MKFPKFDDRDFDNPVSFTALNEVRSNIIQPLDKNGEPRNLLSEFVSVRLPFFPINVLQSCGSSICSYTSTY